MAAAAVIENVHCSGLIVELASADPVVARYRAELDPHARLGVPPHITVLYPFIAGRIGPDVLDALAALFAAVESFDTALTSAGWFGGDVLWLAPDDAQPFVRLTDEVMAAFPAYPPYGGQFDDIVPHLTVGDRADVDAMRGAERELSGQLPIECHADAVTLMTQAEPGGAWTRAVRFPFQ